MHYGAVHTCTNSIAGANSYCPLMNHAYEGDRIQHSWLPLIHQLPFPICPSCVHASWCRITLPWSMLVPVSVQAERCNPLHMPIWLLWDFCNGKHQCNAELCHHGRAAAAPPPRLESSVESPPQTWVANKSKWAVFEACLMFIELLWFEIESSISEESLKTVMALWGKF